MPQTITSKTLTLTNGGGTINLPVTDNVGLYSIEGSGTLSSSWTIQPDGVPFKGMIYKLKYNADFQLNNNSITIFEAVLSTYQVKTRLNIECYYNGTDWEITVEENDIQGLNQQFGVQRIELLSTGGTITLESTKNKKNIRLITTSIPTTLTSSYTITAQTANAKEGQYFWIDFNGSLILGTNTLTIFGINISSLNALRGGFSVYTYFDAVDSTWRAQLIAIPVSPVDDLIKASVGDNSFVLNNDTNVVTGDESVALGSDNSISGDNSFSIGNLNQVFGDNSLAIGKENIVTGDNSIAIGAENSNAGLSTLTKGFQNQAIADYSSAIGLSSVANRFGEQTRSTGKLSAIGYNQISDLQLLGTTSDDIVTEIFLDITTNRITIPTNTVIQFRGKILATQTGGSTGIIGDSGSWIISGIIKNISGVLSFIQDTIFEGKTSKVIAESGVAQLGTFNTITLALLASPINSIYNFKYIRIASGLGVGQVRQITEYVGLTKTATVYPDWDIVPDTTSVYVIETKQSWSDSATLWDIQTIVDNANSALSIKVQGELNKTIQWNGSLQLVENKYN